MLGPFLIEDLSFSPLVVTLSRGSTVPRGFFGKDVQTPLVTMCLDRVVNRKILDTFLIEDNLTPGRIVSNPHHI